MTPRENKDYSKRREAKPTDRGVTIIIDKRLDGKKNVNRLSYKQWVVILQFWAE